MFTNMSTFFSKEMENSFIVEIYMKLSIPKASVSYTLEMVKVSFRLVQSKMILVVKVERKVNE